MTLIGDWRDLNSGCRIWAPASALGLSVLIGRLTDGDSVEIALQDLTVESSGIPKVRTLLADVQARSLHGVPLAELINRPP